MDKEKIAFITCVNDEAEYAECRFYLDQLHIPEGYHVDRIEIRGASSLASGYNAGMQSTDARYKVYLHQDVFMINVELINDLLAVFEKDEQIGLVGVIGSRNPKMWDATRITLWDSGRVFTNMAVLDLVSPTKDSLFMGVQVVDGLFLATQYDIPWREDLFDGWDFYDMSQCMEFRRKGYKIVIPRQKEIWCYHDDQYMKAADYYDHYRSFICEYAEMLGISDAEECTERTVYGENKRIVLEAKRLRGEIEKLITAGEKEGLREIFLEPGVKKQIFLREYESIVCIDWKEEQEGSEYRLWEEGMSARQLLAKWNDLKYMLKRLEYTEEIFYGGESRIEESYSKYAVIDVCSRYIVDKEKVLMKLGRYLTDQKSGI